MLQIYNAGESKQKGQKQLKWLEVRNVIREAIVKKHRIKGAGKVRLYEMRTLTNSSAVKHVLLYKQCNENTENRHNCLHLNIARTEFMRCTFSKQ